MKTFDIPRGWKQEPLSDIGWRDAACLLLISSPEPNRGMVTVDFKSRGFRGGLSIIGKMSSTGTYGGRGWEQALVHAAVRWLDSVARS